MAHFLVVFDRQHGRVLRQERYDDHHLALEGRFAAEKAHRGDPTIEVVVLSAESEEALRRTHARYFLSVPELARRSTEVETARAAGRENGR